VRTIADLDRDGTYETLISELVPFGSTCRGARLATGDLDGDEQPEVILGCGPKGESRVGIFDLGRDGTIGTLRESFLPFGDTFKGGVFVAALDLDGDGRAELVVGQDKGGTGEVRIYSDVDGNGLLQTELTDTFEPLGPLKGGVRLAALNLLSDARDELAVGAGPGSEPRVVVIGDGDGDRMLSDETLLDDFMGLDAGNRGGVFLAGGSVDGAGMALFVGAGSGAATVRIFGDAGNNGLLSDDPMFDEVLAYDQKLGGGVRVAAGDTDESGILVELITVPGKGGAPTLKIFDDDADALSLFSDNPLDEERSVFDAKSKKGLTVAHAKTQPELYACPQTPAGILDLGTVATSLVLPPSAAPISDLDLRLGIVHTFVGDLDVTLTHVPSGISVVVFTDIGGTDEGLFVTLNDEAATDIAVADNPTDGAITGIFNPEGSAVLSAFDGIDASGEWRLTVTDDSASDTGQVFTWLLDVTY
jgi:subtilisin-like proprotein convertase family protein